MRKEQAIVGEPIPPEYTTAAWFNRNANLIADLRAVLAPLLDRDGLAWYAEDCCQFCGESRGTLRHAPDCPVLRRDELLGR